MIHKLHLSRWNPRMYSGFLDCLVLMIVKDLSKNIIYRFQEPIDSSDLPSSRILIASAFSKMLASVITYPHEVLRTRLQVHHLNSSLSPPRSKYLTSLPVEALESSKPETGRKKLVYPRMSETFKLILKTEGIFGFYHGMGVNLIRTVPNSALTILT